MDFVDSVNTRIYTVKEVFVIYIFTYETCIFKVHVEASSYYFGSGAKKLSVLKKKKTFLSQKQLQIWNQIIITMWYFVS